LTSSPSSVLVPTLLCGSCRGRRRCCRAGSVGLAQVLDLSRLAVEAGFEDREHHQVRVWRQSERSELRRAMLFSLPMGMRIMEPRSTADALIWWALRSGERGGIGIHAGIQQQANVVGRG